MNITDIIKKFMLRTLINYLIKEKIIDAENCLIKNVCLSAYEPAEYVKINFSATINSFDYLVEMTIDYLFETTIALNIYKLNDNGYEYDLMKKGV